MTELTFAGTCDFHVHVGEKISGYDLADDFRSISRLAEKAGIIGIGAFVTEDYSPGKGHKTLAKKYEYLSEKAKREFEGFVHWHLTPVHSGLEEISPLLRQGCDLKFYTTYKAAGLYRSYAEIGRWMRDLSGSKVRMLIHCEDEEIIAQNAILHPFSHPFIHTKRRPEEAEVKAVDKVLELAVQNDYPVHIMHVSSPLAALLIRQAKLHAPVTCETAPHYLLLNEEKLKEKAAHRWICTPPLRSENSRGMLLELAQDGIFDIFATDHCPFKKADKDRYRQHPQDVPSGLAGSGALLTILYEGLVKTGKITLESLLERISTNPARLMNIPLNAQAAGQYQIIHNEEMLPVVTSLADTYNLWENKTTSIRVVEV